MERSRREVSKAAVIVVCAPHVWENIGSEVRPRGLVRVLRLTLSRRNKMIAPHFLRRTLGAFFRTYLGSHVDYYTLGTWYATGTILQQNTSSSNIRTSTIGSRPHTKRRMQEYVVQLCVVWRVIRTVVARTTVQSTWYKYSSPLF